MINILAINCAAIDDNIINVINGILTLFQIAIPIIIIIGGSVDFAKAVTSSDEKAIKTAQKSLLNRVIAGVVVFLMVPIVTFFFNMFFEDGSVCTRIESGTDTDNQSQCGTGTVYDSTSGTCVAE